MSDDDDAAANPNVVDVVVDKGSGGFGFNIKGTTQEGGVMQSIAGKLYPPLQYISAVDGGGAAFRADLRKGDRILKVNGVDVQGAQHAQVVDLVVKGGQRLELTILHLDEAETARLQRLEDLYEERKPDGRPAGNMAIISVDDFTNVPFGIMGPEHTVFNVHVNGMYRCAKRYSEFEKLHTALKARFKWFTFPIFPGKKINGLLRAPLTGAELEDRRAALDGYMGYVLAQEDIYKTDFVQLFLKADERAKKLQAEHEARQMAAKRPTVALPQSRLWVTCATGNLPVAPRAARASASSQGSSTSARAAAPASAAPVARPAAAPVNKAPAPAPTPAPAQPLANSTAPAKIANKAAAPSLSSLAIMLPKRAMMNVPLGAGVRDAAAALSCVIAHTKLSAAAARLFALFELVVPSPSGAADQLSGPDAAFERKLGPAEDVLALAGKIVLRKWLFTKQQEALYDDDAAVDDIDRGLFFVGPIADKLNDLKSDKIKYLRTVRKLKAYGGVPVPPCRSDFPAEGSVVQITLDVHKFQVHECSASGVPMVDAEGEAGDHVTMFEWDIISRHSASAAGVAVSYKSDDGTEETMTFATPHSAAVIAVIARIMQERDWLRALKSGVQPSDDCFFAAVK